MPSDNRSSRIPEPRTPNPLLDSIEITDIISIAKAAGDAIMEIYNRDFTIAYKDDKSPLTEADLKSNEIIIKGLQTLSPELRTQNPEPRTPNSEPSALDAPNSTSNIRPERSALGVQHPTFSDIPILSEEGKEIPYEERKNWEYYWCIDPIDGTKEFIKKNGEFTVNIALIHKDTPVLGVVYAPALGDMYWATKGRGAFKAEFGVQGSGFRKEQLERARALPLNPEPRTQNSLVIVASKSHLSKETENFIESLKTTSSRTPNPEPGTREIVLISKGSSLKLVMVAEGTADIYPRLAPTMEWDTAAADAIVREAGKMTYQYHSTSNIRPGRNDPGVQHPTLNTDTSVVKTKDGFQPQNPEPRTPNPEPLKYNKKDLLNPWFVVQ